MEEYLPIFKNRTAIEIARNVRAFFKLEIGIVRGETPKPQNTDHKLQQQLAQMRKQLERKEKENARLRSQTTHADRQESVKPENIIWIFGTGRTGSSWLSAMMHELEQYTRWDEPYVGDLFGSAYYLRVGDRMRKRKHFILGDHYKEAWLKAIRNFILEGATARFPTLTGKDHLVIKEPNGSIGAPILAEALPESRLIFLVRDPRDVVASTLDALRKGSWGSSWKSDAASLADSNPDEFVRQRAYLCAQGLEKTKEAYEAHKGCKVTIRYEDLRHHAMKTMEHIFFTLKLPVDRDQLVSVVEKHAWENIPEEQKGLDKPRRKAKPGGWKEDLTPKQVEIVEEITAPILKEFYPG